MIVFVCVFCACVLLVPVRVRVHSRVRLLVRASVRMCI